MAVASDNVGVVVKGKQLSIFSKNVMPNGRSIKMSLKKKSVRLPHDRPEGSDEKMKEVVT